MPTEWRKSLFLFRFACRLSRRLALPVLALFALADAAQGQTFSIGGSVPTLFGNIPTQTVGIGTSTLTSGAALTVVGGGYALPGGQAVQWNADTFLCRVNPAVISVGSSCSSPTGTFEAAQFQFVGNSNLTNVSLGVIELGVGGTPGAGGTLNLGTLNVGTSLNFTAWPVLVAAPDSSVFLYSTQAFTTGSTSPYSNNLAMGDHTLNPTTHYSSVNCYLPNSGLTGFCGDEVAFGAYTLSADQYGRDNTAIGDHALANCIACMGNTAIGSSAAANVQSQGVDAFGTAACEYGTYAGPITCIGQASLQVAGNGSGHLSTTSVAVGYQSGLVVTNIQYSSLFGDNAAGSATTITDSIIEGQAACSTPTTIGNSICLVAGQAGGPAVSTMSNTLWISGCCSQSTPILYGNLSTNALAVNTTTISSGAILSLAGGDVELAAGYGFRWNNDAGFNRFNPSGINCGTGAANDFSCTLALTQLNFGNGANFTSPAAGVIQAGTGGTAGTGATVNATGFNGTLGQTTPAAAKVTTLAASSTVSGAGFGVYAETVFTSSGNFTAPANSSTSTVYKYRACAGGGGGGGANGSAAGAGGGGSGACAEGYFSGVAASATVTLTVGAAGSGGANTGGNGGSGGATTIGSPVSVVLGGGSGGTGSTATSASYASGGAAGALTSGSPSVTVPGAQGGFGFYATSAIIVGGSGASSMFGPGGFGSGPGFGYGGPASAYGAGGGGAIYLTGPGGAGASGVVIIERMTP